MAFVNCFGIFECDHGAKTIQRNISESAILYFVADDGFAFALVGIAAELAVTAMLTVASLDAFRFDAERRLSRICLRRHHVTSDEKTFAADDIQPFCRSSIDYALN